MDAALLDTDILTDVFKGRNANVRNVAEAYLSEHGSFTISQFTHFEIMRGLLATNATTKIGVYGQLARSIDMLPITIQVLEMGGRDLGSGEETGTAQNGRRHSDCCYGARASTAARYR